MHPFKHISGNKAAMAMTKEAIKGTTIGFFLAIGYKFAVMDPAENVVSNFYKGRAAVKN